MISGTKLNQFIINSLEDIKAFDLKEINKSVANIEGEVDGEWVLVDLNEVLVHIMLPTTRAYFNLEELWQS